MFQRLKDLAHGITAKRSSKWPALEKQMIKAHPFCSVCRETKSLNCHHVLPFHDFPANELDLTNLIVLCHDCHLNFGHLKNWKSYNKDVRSDASVWNAKIANRPK